MKKLNFNIKDLKIDNFKSEKNVNEQDSLRTYMEPFKAAYICYTEDFRDCYNTRFDCPTTTTTGCPGTTTSTGCPSTTTSTGCTTTSTTGCTTTSTTGCPTPTSFADGCYETKKPRLCETYSGGYICP